MAPTPSYYDAWRVAGLSLPEEPKGLRDWHQTSQLSSKENYLIHGRIKHISMALGWGVGCDVDSSATLFDGECVVVDTVWWKKMKSDCGCVTHSGDNRTGGGPRPNEVIQVHLEGIPLHVHHVLFLVCVYTEGKTFSEVQNACVQMFHGKTRQKNHLLCEYNSLEMGGKAMMMGALSRMGAYWNFKALGCRAIGQTAGEVVKQPANLEVLRETRTHSPLLRQLLFRVKQARDLIPKDNALFQSGKADPFVEVRFKGNKVFSKVKPETLNPSWDMQYIDLGFIRESEHKAIKVTIWDHDKMTTNDFMGIVRIPASAFYNLGPGTFEWWMPLCASKIKRYQHVKVGGEVLVEVKVLE